MTQADIHPDLLAETAELTHPDLQQKFAGWLHAVLEGQKPPAPPAPPQWTPFFRDQAPWRGRWFKTPGLLAINRQPPWAASEAAWHLATLTAALLNPAVQQMLVSCAVRWQHTHALWNPPDVWGRPASTFQDFSKEPRALQVSLLPPAAAFWMFASWCAQNSQGNEQRTWQKWAGVGARWVTVDSFLWQAASGQDMVCLHALAVASRTTRDLAPILRLLERGNQDFTWKGLTPLARHLNPYGVRQRLLQEMAWACRLRFAQPNQPVDGNAMPAVAQAVQLLDAHLQRHTGEPQPEEFNVVLFLFTLMDFILEGFQPGWLQQATNPLIALLETCPDALLRSQIRESLNGFSALVRLPATGSKRFGELLARPLPDTLSMGYFAEETGRRQKILQILAEVVTHG